MSFVEDVLSRNNYLVRVNIDSNGENIVVDYAGMCSARYEIFQYSGEYGIFFRNTDESLDEFIPMDPILIRIYLLAEIYRQCRLRSLPYSIVRFYDADGVQGELTKFIDLHLNESEAKAERSLNDGINVLYNKGIASLREVEEKMTTAGLTHRFNFLKGLLL